MSFEVFFYAIAAIFLAELGDKTMLATICLSAQYRRPMLVLLAAMLALTASTVIAVIIGMFLASTLPLDLIMYIAGALFIIMGLYTLATSGRNEAVGEVSSGTFWSMFSLVFIAELGDKTQIAAFALSAQSTAPLLVFIGAIIGFFFVTLLGAIIGDRIAERAPIVWIKRVTGIFFILIGILSIFGIIS